MSDEILKPCPFCGGKAQMIEIPPHTHKIASWMPDRQGEVFIACTSCTCAMSAKTKKEAENAWNKRLGYQITIVTPERIGR